MKLYLTPKTLKKIIKMLILFILACILIYFSNTLNVKAEGGTTTSNSLGDIIFPTSIAVYDNLGTSLTRLTANSYQSFSSEVATRAWVIQSTPIVSNGIVVSIPVPDLVYGHSYVLLNYWATSSTQRIGLAWANNLRFGLNRYLDNFDYQSYSISPYYSDVFPMSNITLSIPVNETQLANTLYVSTDITKFTNNVQNDTLSAIYFSQMTDGASNIGNYYYLGYRLIDITTLTTSQQEQLNRIEASINSLSLSEVNSKLDAIQEEQKNTSDAIDEQTKQDQVQHEEQMEQDKQQHEETMDTITDSSAPDLAVGDTAGWLPPGPVDSVLNLPLTILNSLISNLSNKTCSAVDVPLPYIDKSVQLPCLSTIFDKTGFTDVLNTISIPFAIFIYINTLIKLYGWVDATLQFREEHWNDVDQWGGI